MSQMSLSRPMESQFETPEEIAAAINTAVAAAERGVMRDNLLALAARCKEATWPFRDLELDLAIAQAVGAAPAAWWFSHERVVAVGFLDVTERVLAYTSSLDAARKLVPEGFRIDLRESLSGHTWSVALRGKPGKQPEGKAVTAELAMCAAALRAQSASLDTGSALPMA